MNQLLNFLSDQFAVHLLVSAGLAWGVAVICRVTKPRPAIEHALWLLVLVKLCVPTICYWPWSLDVESTASLSEMNAVSETNGGTETPPLDTEDRFEFEPVAAENRALSGDVPNDTAAEIPNSEDDLSIALVTAPNLDAATELDAAPELDVVTELDRVNRLLALLEENTELYEPVDSTTNESENLPIPLSDTMTDVRAATPWSLSAWCGIHQSTLYTAGWCLLGLAGVFLLARELRRSLRLRYWIANAPTASANVQETIADLCRELRISPPRCVVTPGSGSPLVWSAGRTWLVLPERCVEGLAPRALRAVLAHELAHLRRRDHFTGWLLFAGQITHWWNPLYWILRRRICESAELACDAMAMELSGADGREYAGALVDLTQAAFGPPATAWGARSAALRTFRRRLSMILEQRPAAFLAARHRVFVVAVALLVLPGWIRVGVSQDAAGDAGLDEGGAPAASDSTDSNGEDVGLGEAAGGTVRAETDDASLNESNSTETDPGAGLGRKKKKTKKTKRRSASVSELSGPAGGLSNKKKRQRVSASGAFGVEETAPAKRGKKRKSATDSILSGDTFGESVADSPRKKKSNRRSSNSAFDDTLDSSFTGSSRNSSSKKRPTTGSGGGVSIFGKGTGASGGQRFSSSDATEDAGGDDLFDNRNSRYNSGAGGGSARGRTSRDFFGDDVAGDAAEHRLAKLERRLEAQLERLAKLEVRLSAVLERSTAARGSALGGTGTTTGNAAGAPGVGGAVRSYYESRVSKQVSRIRCTRQSKVMDFLDRNPRKGGAVSASNGWLMIQGTPDYIRYVEDIVRLVEPQATNNNKRTPFSSRTNAGPDDSSPSPFLNSRNNTASSDSVPRIRRVMGKDGQYMIVTGGQKHGFRPGDKVDVHRGVSLIGRAKIIECYADHCLCGLIYRKGDKILATDKVVNQTHKGRAESGANPLDESAFSDFADN
ncbi:MAG: M56 family metallopeptidase [Planctomycetota bacterium]